METNNCPAIVKDNMGNEKHGYIIKEAINRINDQMIVVRFKEQGWGPRPRTLKIKGTIPVPLYLKDCYFRPFKDINDALNNPKAVTYLFGFMDDAFPMLSLKMEELENSVEDITNKYDGEKEKRDALVEEIKTLKEENKNLISQITDLAQRK